jgi:HEPN domain-containing protein
MNDFTKTKIAFAVALLAALFTITPILSSVGSWGYAVFSITLQINYLYYFLATFLTVSVYAYSLQFLTERQFRPIQLAGDIFYAIALISAPVYVSVYLLTLVADLAARLLQAPGTANGLANVASLLIGVAASVVVNYIVRVFGRKERESSVETIQKEEIAILGRAMQLFQGGYFDLTIVEAFKAIELSIRKALLDANILLHRTNTRTLMEKARELELFPDDLFQQIDTLRNLRNSISHENVPIEQVNAEQALVTTGKALAAIESRLAQSRRGSNQTRSTPSEEEG